MIVVDPDRAADHGNAWSVYFRDTRDERSRAVHRPPWPSGNVMAIHSTLDKSNDEIVAAAPCALRGGSPSRSDRPSL